MARNDRDDNEGAEVDIERNRCCCGCFKVETCTYVVAILAALLYFSLLWFMFYRDVGEQVITEVKAPHTNAKRMRDLSKKSLTMMVAVVGMCAAVIIAQRIGRPMFYVPFLALNGGAAIIAIAYIFLYLAIIFDPENGPATTAMKSVLPGQYNEEDMEEFAPFAILAYSIFASVALWFEYMVCRAYEVTLLKRGDSGGGGCGLCTWMKSCCC